MADYATLLRDHTTLTCRSVDRIFLQGYVPGLQSPGLVARFLLQRGYPFPSSAALGEIGEKYVAEIKQWATAEGVPVRYFKTGEKKDLDGQRFHHLQHCAAGGRTSVATSSVRGASPRSPDP